MGNNNYTPAPQNPTSKISPLPLLDEMIRDHETSLRYYIEKGNPNESYVRKQNDTISKLCTIYNFIEDLTHLEYYLLIEDAINTLLRKDSEISVFNIEIKVKKGFENIAKITLNPFDDEAI